ncbi:MAG: NADH-quinone oxidoreductase subunit C [Vicinamibacterales bacterium]
MDASAIIDAVNALVPDGGCEATPSVDFPTIYVPAARLIDVCQALRDAPALRYNVLIELTAADYLPRLPRFEVVYHLLSIAHRARLRVKVRVADGELLPTAQGVWPAAGWPEREVYDMFGIIFAGHPDLRRILTPDDWEGHPARKDYPVQIKKAVQTYEPLEVTQEEFQANLERDRVRRSL